MTSTPTRVRSLAAGSALVALTAGCMSQSESDRRSGALSHRPDTAGLTATHTNQARDQMNIRITIGDQQFRASLNDTAASRDLVALLPLTIDMTDHGGVEKTGPLPSPLSLQGQPEGADPDVGEVGYYAPGHDFVLYYGDQSYYRGIVILGRLEGDAAQKIANIDGAITARVAAV